MFSSTSTSLCSLTPGSLSSQHTDIKYERIKEKIALLFLPFYLRVIQLLLSHLLKNFNTEKTHLQTFRVYCVQLIFCLLHTYNFVKWPICHSATECSTSYETQFIPLQISLQATGQNSSYYMRKRPQWWSFAKIYIKSTWNHQEVPQICHNHDR
jgi:hypothetical protein